MRALGRRCLVTVVVAGAAAVSGAAWTEKEDAEFAVVVEQGTAPNRPRVRLHNRTASTLAICTDAMSGWELWHQDGRMEGSGAGVPAAGDGIGYNGCENVGKWSVVEASSDTLPWMPDLPAVRAEDELVIHWFIWVSPRVGDLRVAKLGLYKWRGKLSELEQRGGRTSG